MKVERYSFTLTAVLTLGEPQEFGTKEWTMRKFEVRNVLSNAPCPGFAILEDVVADGIALSPFQAATVDAYAFRMQEGGLEVDSVLCDHGMAMRGKYSGLIPEGLSPGQKFVLTITLQGPTGESLKSPKRS